MHWAKVYKLRAISLRLFNVFGTRSRTSGARQIWCISCAKDK